MVSVVSLANDIGDRQLNLVQPEPVGLAAGRQSQAVAEMHQDGGGLSNHEIPVTQERGSKGWPQKVVSFNEGHKFFVTVRLKGDIDIVGASVLQRQPHKFAAALNAAPIIELIGHGPLPPPSLTRSHGGDT